MLEDSGLEGFVLVVNTQGCAYASGGRFVICFGSDVVVVGLVFVKLFWDVGVVGYVELIGLAQGES